MRNEAEKARWRTRILAARAALTPPRLAAAAEEVRGHLLTRLNGISRIAAYVPFGAEPGSLDLLDALRRRSTVVLLPVMRPNVELGWAVYHGREALVAGAWGVLEPAGESGGSAWLDGVEAILVPALGVDHQGTRLGRGAGYYDRALASAPVAVPIIALLHDGELVPRLPADPWDRPVTAAVTPANGWTNLPLMPHHES